MMVLISGGEDAALCSPFMIFKNENRTHPIRGVPDDVTVVSYRTGPKAWMDCSVFSERINEKRALPRLPGDRKRVPFMDNCNSHGIAAEIKAVLKKANTEIRFFHANGTDMVQPADSFVVQKIKAAWRSEWEAKKLDMIKKMFVNPRDRSGKLGNPGKRYFLGLARGAVRDVNGQSDKNGMLYARKAMICCGMALNEDGKWEESELFDMLRKIIDRYRENFEGKAVDETADLEGEATEMDEDDENSTVICDSV